MTTAPIKRPRLISDVELLDMPDSEFLIDGVLPRRATGCIYSPPGAGKTTICAALSVAVATKTSFFGHAVLHQGATIYVGSDDPHGWKPRLLAKNADAGWDLEALETVRVPGRFELAPSTENCGTRKGFVDPAGGSGKDSMTGGVASTEQGKAILEAVWEIRPPFSPEAAVKELAANFKRYGVTEITSDRYAGSWPTEAFRKEGITVKPSEKTRSEIYLAVLPMIMSGQVELLDSQRLLKQLSSLERRRGRQGKDSVDAPPRQHEDLANSACGALVLAGAGVQAAARMFNVFTGEPIEPWWASDEYDHPELFQR